MSIYYPSIDTTTPVYTNLINSSPVPEFVKFVGEFNTDFDKSVRLVRNADVIFKCASINLQRMAAVCLVAALLSTLGGLGATFCKREYKKTRFAFACLTVMSAALSIFAALGLFHMYNKASTYSGFFERRWSS